MFKRTLTLIAFTLAAHGAMAGGLAPPLDESPRPIARSTPGTSPWADPYAALIIGNHETESDVTTSEDIVSTGEVCVEKQRPIKMLRYFINKPQPEPEPEFECETITTTETATSTDTVSTSDMSYGFVAGSRVDVGNGFLLGGELTAMTTEDDSRFAMAEATLSYDFGDALAHIDLGFGTDGDHSGLAGSIGADFALGNDWFAGAEVYRADLGDGGNVSGALFRVGLRF